MTELKGLSCLEQAGVLRNLFRPVTHWQIVRHTEWLTPLVFNLAQQAYDLPRENDGTLDPNRLAVLSDALEEAGCDNEAILQHLRSSEPHYRGCWALDLILGKS